MVNTTWTNPTSLDLPVDWYLTDTIWGQTLSDLKAVGGSTGTVSARVYHNAAQSIASGTPTALAFNSERFDVEGFHDLATNNSRLTVPAGYGGTYLIVGHVETPGGSTGYRQAYIRLNGATIIGIDASTADTNSTYLNPVALYNLAAGDYVELVFTQNSGAAVNVTAAGNYGAEFAVAKV